MVTLVSRDALYAYGTLDIPTSFYYSFLLSPRLCVTMTLTIYRRISILNTSVFSIETEVSIPSYSHTSFTYLIVVSLHIRYYLNIQSLFYRD